MPTLVATDGDLTALGGVIVAEQVFVKINGKPIVTIGSIVLPHNGPPHDGGGTIITGSPFVRINGIGISGIGDLASCGDAIATVSQSFVFA